MSNSHPQWKIDNISPALSGVFDINQTMNETFSHQVKLPKWDVLHTDFIEDKLDNYSNPHVQSILMDIREMIPEKQWDRIFVAGGFTSYAAGITKTHDDVDLFVCTYEAFATLTAYIIQRPDKFQCRHPKDVFKKLNLKIQKNAYGHVLKFKYRNINYDLIDNCNGGEVRSWTLDADQQINSAFELREILCSFDLNWAMSGIDLANDLIICHKDAFRPEVWVNPCSKKVNASNVSRVKKYAERLTRKVDMDQVHEIITILESIPSLQEWDSS